MEKRLAPTVFEERENPCVDCLLKIASRGFAVSLSEVGTGSLGAGDYYWGGAASTIFWVDPVEDLVAIFMTQLMPSATFNFRGQLKNIIYGAIEH